METKLGKRKSNLKEENMHLRNIINWYAHKPDMYEAFTGIKDDRPLSPDEYEYAWACGYDDDDISIHEDNISIHEDNRIYEDDYPYFIEDQIPTLAEIFRREEEERYWRNLDEQHEIAKEEERYLKSGLREVYTALDTLQENIKDLECEKHKMIVDCLYHIINGIKGRRKEYIMGYFKYTFNYLTPIEELNKVLDELLK